MKYIYKTETFGFSTRRELNKELDELLEKYSKDGWRLHTMQVTKACGGICVCVFEKEVE